MKRKMNREITTLFRKIADGLAGCWSDSLSLDKTIIEAHTCPKCWKPLEYRGFSNAAEYQAFGICGKCEYAKHFWTETVETISFKKKICSQAKIRVEKAVA